jgi:low affinity Fe/Cu permease
MNIIKIFDRLEDRVRGWLSKRPTLYALIGGFAIVLFWRGVWDFADEFAFLTPVVSIVLSVLIMMVTGTFVSFFIGGRLLISGLMAEKRLDEKTAEEIRDEENELIKMRKTLSELKGDIEDIKKLLNK